MKKLEILKNFILGDGKSQSTRIGVYYDLKNYSDEKLVDYLDGKFTRKEINQLLVSYIREEFRDRNISKIRITQEQFDEMFNIIKPQISKVGDSIEEVKKRIEYYKDLIIHLERNLASEDELSPVRGRMQRTIQRHSQQISLLEERLERLRINEQD